MGLLQGTLTIQRFIALGPVPSESELLAGLERDRFFPFQDGSEEERIGWCDWRNPLLVPADPAWVSQDRYTVFGLRIDTRKVPAATLKAHVDLRIQTLAKEKDLAFIGKEARLSIQDELKAELLRKEQPRTRLFEVAWDSKAGRVLTTAASSGASSALISLFQKSFGVELQLEIPVLTAERVTKTYRADALIALEPLDLCLKEPA